MRLRPGERGSMPLPGSSERWPHEIDVYRCATCGEPGAEERAEACARCDAAVCFDCHDELQGACVACYEEHSCEDCGYLDCTCGAKGTP